MGDARTSRRVAALVASLLAGSTAGASAQPTPEGVELLGPDLAASQDPTPRVSTAAIGVAPQGHFLVTWRWDVFTLPSQVRGRLYSADQQPLGDEFRIDTEDHDVREVPIVAPQADGTFVVVWEQASPSAEPLGLRHIDLPAEPEVGVALPDGGWFPLEMAPGPQGRFVVTRDGCTSYTTDPPCGGVPIGYGYCCLESRVRSQTYDPDGTPVGAVQEIAVTHETLLLGRPEPGPGGVQGSFLVVTSDELDRTALGVTRLDADGAPMGGAVTLAVGAAALEVGTERVAGAPNGDLLVAWSEREPEPNPGFDSDVRLRRFASDGTPLGAAFEINELTADDQQLAGLAVSTDGSALVAFRSVGSLGDDSSALSVQARAFRPDGSAMGMQFQVNASTADNQITRAVAAGPDGRFVVAWSEETFGVNVPPPTARARALQLSGLFADGFESGDSSRWSPQTR